MRNSLVFSDSKHVGIVNFGFLISSIKLKLQCHYAIWISGWWNDIYPQKMDLDKFAYNLYDFYLPILPSFSLSLFLSLFILLPVVASILFVFIQLFESVNVSSFYAMQQPSFNIHQFRCNRISSSWMLKILTRKWRFSFFLSFFFSIHGILSSFPFIIHFWLN